MKLIDLKYNEMVWYSWGWVNHFNGKIIWGWPIQYKIEILSYFRWIWYIPMIVIPYCCLEIPIIFFKWFNLLTSFIQKINSKLFLFYSFYCSQFWSFHCEWKNVKLSHIVYIGNSHRIVKHHNGRKWSNKIICIGNVFTASKNTAYYSGPISKQWNDDCKRIWQT